MTNDHETRQSQLLSFLSDAAGPLRGEDLAKTLGVTRQVVVHDIALLRASGVDVVATPRGYYLARASLGRHREVLAVRHGVQQTGDELYTLVDHGILVVNVMVEHPVYGEISGTLRIESRLDVDQFLDKISRHHAHLLSDLTGGYHMHEVEFSHRVQLDKAVAALVARGIEVFP